MLILTRRAGQRIRIGRDVTVEVVSVRDGQVRVGVTAPRSMQVDREEVAERKDVEREIAELMRGAP